MRLRECSICGWNGPRRRMRRNPGGTWACRNEDMCASRHRLRWYLEHFDEINARSRAEALERRRRALAEFRAGLASRWAWHGGR